MSDPHQADMFGLEPSQDEIFDNSAGETPSGKLTPDDIRREMLELIATARATKTMPWTPRQIRSHTALFPYMAEWLDEPEGQQLLLDFKVEMDRLGAPADQVAPNWRTLWGLAA